MIFLSGSFFSRVYAALAQREGKKTTLPTLVSMTGLTETQIQNTITNARRTSDVHRRQIEVVKPGREWKFKGDTSAGGYAKPDDVVKAVEVGSQHIWKNVLAALVSNAGKVTHKNLLAERASTPDREITPAQAASAMQTVLRQPEIAPHVEVVWAGNAWRYVDPQPKVEKITSGQPASKSIRGSVVRYLTQKPGEVLSVNDMAADLGFTVKQVQNAMWSIINENHAMKDDVVVVLGGHAWQYKPNRGSQAEDRTEVKAEANGHAPLELKSAPAQAYAPEAATTTLPVSPDVPRIPAATVATPKPVAVATATAPGGRLFEEIAQLGDDVVLVKEAESGTVYRAEPLR